MSTKDTIIKLLVSTKRGCVDQLIAHLVRKGFFECPASTKFYGAYEGGLAEHSLRVHELLHDKCQTLSLDSDTSAGRKPLKIDTDTAIIAGLLHDVCKVGGYILDPGGKNPYRWNKEQPEGHATLSIKRIKQFIALKPLEEMLIRFHMGNFGMYELYEPGSWEWKTQAEYHMRCLDPKKKGMSAAEKKADKEARYGKSWRNAIYHNIVVFWMHVADMQATAEEKAKS